MSTTARRVPGIHRSSRNARAARSLYRAESLECRRMLIASGETILGAISIAGEVDDYTFTANAGDAVIAGVSETVAGSALAPRLQLLAPGGAVLFNVAGAVGNESSAFNLAASGTYTLRVTDNSNAQTGAYAVSLAKLPDAPVNSGDGGAVASGEYKSGTIDVGDLDIYTINANSGGSLVAFAGELAGQSMDIAMNVIGPSGQSLFAGTAAGVSATTQVLLPASGTYYVVVYDNGFNATGSYNLSLAVVPGAQTTDPDSAPLSSGVRRTGTIEAADLDVYTITAPLSGTLLVDLSEINAPASTFQPQLQVYSPSGALLINSAGSVGRDFVVPSTVGGTYTIVVFDQSFDTTGDYAITAVTAPGAQPTDADRGPTTSGQYRTGTIDLGDADVYTINANAGGSLLLDLAKTAGAAIDPSIIVNGPTGAVLLNTSNTAAVTSVLTNLAVSGTYTITIWDSGADAAGAYGLTVVALPAGTQPTDADSGPIVSGQYRSGTLDAGDIDVFTVSVNLGSSFLVSLSEAATGALNPQLLVFTPSGALAINTAGVAGVTYLQSNVAAAGTYVICVLDQFGNDTGGYDLTVVNGTGAQSSDGDSGPLGFDTYAQGTIDPGDIDVYTLNGTQASSLLTELSESEFIGPSATGDVGLVIFAPNGSVLRNTTGAEGLTVLDANLAATGNYTLAVYEPNADAFQRYALTSVALDATPVPVGEGGPLASGQTVRGSLDYGNIDAYSVTVNAGQSLLLALQDIDNSTFAPDLIIATPSGATLINTAGTTGVTFRADNLAAGTYKVFVFDQGGNDFGNYAMTLALSANASQPTAGDSGVLTGTGRRGEITAGDLDVYTVAASAAVNFTVTLNETPSGQAFQPRMIIYRPDGTVFSDTTVTNAASVAVTGVQAGNYLVVVTDSGSDATGSYGISLGATAPATDTSPPHITEAAYRFDRPSPQLVVYASENVAASLQTSDFTLVNTTTGVTVPTSSLSLAYETSSDRMLIGAPGEPGGLLGDGSYTLTIGSAGVSDASGNLLDGNGDGTGGDNYVLHFFVLAGDANHDGKVAFDDLLTLAKNYGKIGMPFSGGNFNYDQSGTVDFSDLLALAKNYGKTFAPAPAIADALPVASVATTSTRKREATVVSGVIT